MAIVFAVTTIICAIGWLVRWLNTLTLLLYLLEKGYPEPTKEEWEVYTGQVIWQMIRSSD